MTARFSLLLFAALTACNLVLPTREPPDGASPNCGDGILQRAETCDGTLLRDATCETEGFPEGGILACNDLCGFDTSGCFTGPECGDGFLQNSEACDATQLWGQTCEGQGFAEGGALGCSDACELDTSACFDEVVCNDGFLQNSESCDGTALGTNTCVSEGFPAGGTLRCAGDCTLDTSLCFLESICGDGYVQTGESCDGTALADETCVSQGFIYGGELSCSGECGFDTAACNTECVPDTNEPNNDQLTATLLSVNTLHEGMTICDCDVDWIIFPFDTDSSYTIELFFAGEYGDLDMELFDDSSYVKGSYTFNDPVGGPYIDNESIEVAPHEIPQTNSGMLSLRIYGDLLSSCTDGVGETDKNAYALRITQIP